MFLIALVYTSLLNCQSYKSIALVGHTVIPALWEAKVGELFESGVHNQPGEHGETPFLPKIQKLVGGGGTCL